MKALDRATRRGDKWFPRQFPDLAREPIAYFSAEFGLHTSLPIYSGGLGILAGDHCKESSDLGIPLLGVGFVYPQGYFHQRIQADGWQEDIYELLERSEAPIEFASPKHDERFLVELNVGSLNVFVVVWRVNLGAVPLYLMDTDVDENQHGDRELSARLYGGDKELRVRQEILLGIGSTKAEFMELGKFGDPFYMTVLALRMTGWRNGVSHLHGRVTRRMWQVVWPEVPEDQVPITSVTNGVHAPTWIGQELSLLFDRYLGPAWVDRHDDISFWNCVMDI